MATFADGFDRADGSLGGNWVTIAGSPGIESGWVRNTIAGVCSAYNTTVSDGGRHQCITRQTFQQSVSNSAGPIVKFNSSSGNGYFAFVVLSSSVWYLRIAQGVATSPTTLASQALDSTPPGIYNIVLTWEDGVLTASIPGMATVSAEATTYANGTLMGLRATANTQMVDSVYMVTGAAQDFQVTPSAIPNYGTATTLTFTGTNTEWGTGTPGTPTFTCDHGSLSSQEVTGAGSATAIYSPGNYLGTVVFTDPSTGLTDTCVVTSDIGVVPPGGADPWMEDDGAMVHATVANWTPNPILNAGTLISASGAPELNVDIVTAIGEIWAGMYHFGLISRPEGAIDRLDQIWKGLNSTLIFDGATYVPDNPGGVKEDTDTIRTSLAALRTTGDYTLTDVIVALQGTPSVTLAQLAEAIDAVSAPDLQPILDAIAAVRGLGTPDLTTILGVIDDLTAGSTVDLGMLSTALSGVATTTTSTATAVSAIATAIDNGFAAVLDAIAAIQPGGGGAGAPTWPGLSGVTLGASTPLASSLDLEGPMDGIVVDVTGVDTGVTWYTYHDVKAYRAVGALAFYTDRGDIEAFQTLGFEQAIYVPKTMRHAGGVKLFCSHGLSGTVQPWTVS